MLTGPDKPRTAMNKGMALSHPLLFCAISSDSPGGYNKGTPAALHRSIIHAGQTLA
jgi:hypothetical protein